MLLSFGRENHMNPGTRERRTPVPLCPRHFGVTRRLTGMALLATGLLACDARPDRESAAGSTVTTVPLTATRVVSLVPSLAELMVTIGAGDLIVARTDYDTHPAVVPLPSVGGGLDPSLEALVQLEVDVVLMPEGQEMPALAARLGDLGISAVGFRTETVADLYDSIDRLGALVGRPDEAQALARDIATGLAEVEARVSDRPAVSVMYVIWSDPPMTTAGGSYIDELITIAGGRNVFADAPTRWPSVGYESIVRRNPSVLVWPRGATSDLTLDVIREMPGWRDLEAVQSGRVVFVDSDRFNRPGSDLALAAADLARAFHPDAFTGTRP